MKIITRNGIALQIDLLDNGLIRFPFRFYKPGAPKAVAPPALPPPVAQTSEIAESASRVGESEGRRLRKKTGRRATTKTRPELANIPANIGVAGLKTTTG